jgi:hypothetical protein
MRNILVHRCRCTDCRRRTPNATKEAHARLNRLLSTLDEQQRRLLAGYESSQLGHGGDRRLAIITGLDVHTIAKGRHALASLQPSERIRAPGGGRPRVEKKTQRF